MVQMARHAGGTDTFRGGMTFLAGCNARQQNIARVLAGAGGLVTVLALAPGPAVDLVLKHTVRQPAVWDGRSFYSRQWSGGSM